LRETQRDAEHSQRLFKLHVIDNRFACLNPTHHLRKVRILYFQCVLTRCKDICPMITHHLVEVQRLLNGRVGRDIFFYSISLSPEEDSPAALKVYAKMHNVGVATVIQTEADAPLKGSVAGVRQEDVVSKAVNVGTDFFSFAAAISETLSALVKLCFSVR
jgi:cytochrome oxidase Cu insertion factor (SCO1/SenC/PrrC family)